MSYAQFGYPYHPASQFLVSGQSGGNSMPPNPCCESGRVVTDPVTSQMVFSCQQCDTHSMVPRLGSSVPTTPYGAYAPEQTYPPVGMGVETPAFYSPIANPYLMKEGGNDVTGSFQSMQSAGYYPYDPSLAYGYGYDVNGARRKNATREATATLKAWLNEHRKNPYPTKGEKIMLAIITKMTLTQVSTWFANARRRLKKENKMTWESKGKDDDEDDDDGGGGKVSDDDDDTKDLNIDNRNQVINKMDGGYNEKGPDVSKDHLREGLVGPNCLPLAPTIAASTPITHNPLGHIQRLAGPCDSLATTSIANHPLQPHHSMTSHHPSSLDHMTHRPPPPPQQQLSRYPPSHAMDLHHEQSDRINMVSVGDESDMSLHVGHPRVPPSSSPSMSQNKPKIWSLADTATCKTPPTASLVPLVQRPNRSIGPTSIVNRSTDGQWQPSTVYQRPITSYQSGQPTPSAGANNNYVHPYHQQSSSSVPLALLVHDKNQNSSPSSSLAINQHSAMLNPPPPPPPPPGCDVIASSSPTAVIASSSNRTSAVINQCSNNPFNELQTDTPPQTPPNHKFPLTANGGAGGAGSYVSRLGHTSHVGPNQGPAYNSVDIYGGQRALLSRLPEFREENSDPVSNNFQANSALSHVNNSNNDSNNSVNNSANAMEGTAFKPVYKSSLPNNGNLVTV